MGKATSKSNSLLKDSLDDSSDDTISIAEVRKRIPTTMCTITIITVVVVVVIVIVIVVIVCGSQETQPISLLFLSFLF